MRLLASARVVAAVGLALFVMACKKDNPLCPGENEPCPEIDARIDAPDVVCTTIGPDPACPNDRPVCSDSICVGCGVDTECSGRPGVPVCFGEPAGACVACDENNRQAPEVNSATDECQTAGMQVCDGTLHTCRPCGADAECTSGICDAGTCVAAGNIAYLVPPPTGTDNPTCAQATPCATLRQGVAAMKSVILVAPGAYMDTRDADLNGRNVTIRATGATFTMSGNNDEVLVVRGASQVVITGGTFDGSGDGANSVIRQDDVASFLTLEGVTVTGSAANGITTGMGRLTVRRSTITTNALIGIVVDSAGQPFELTRSTVMLNGRSGVAVTAAQSVVIVNNFILKNAANVVASALRLDSVGSASRIEFNTIAGNSADDATAGAGVLCGATTTTIRNSIVFANDGASQVSNCTIRFSTVQGATPDGPNGIIVDPPNFLDTGNNNYGLMPGSPVAAKADPAADLTGPAATDHAGDARPLPVGSRADLGADEIQ